MISALLIAGPTASGKTALAIKLAQRLNGWVINADSMQVYRNLPILTAQPTLDERAGIPHLLLGHISGHEAYSVGRWVADAQEALKQCREAAKLPIFIGGTGLYFKMLLHGLSELPHVPADIRQRVRQTASHFTPEQIRALLIRQHPSFTEATLPRDPQRLIRIMEIWEATGQPISAFHEARRPAVLPPSNSCAIFLAPVREILYTRINTRFAHMYEHGALDEVRAWLTETPAPDLPLMRAHGVPALCAHLNGTCTREEAVAWGQRDTRHYAKRQMTFFRTQLPEFIWTTPKDAEKMVMERIASLLL